MSSYTKTPNEIYAIMHDMSESELKLTLALCRQTYGYHREDCVMTFDDLEKETGLSRMSVARGLKEVEARGFFRKNGKRSRYETVTNCDQNSNNLLPDDDNSNNMLPDNSNNMLPKESHIVTENSNNMLPPTGLPLKEKKKKENIKESKKPPTPLKSKRRGKKSKADLKTIQELLPENINVPAVMAVFADFLEHRQMINSPMTPLAVKRIMSKAKDFSPDDVIWVVNQSIENGWKGIFWDKLEQGQSAGKFHSQVPAKKKAVMGEF